MAKQLSAVFIPVIFESNRLDELPELLENHEAHLLDSRLWANNAYHPRVSFKLAYTQNSILLKYEVTESELIAFYRQLNDPVYKDSCVEFFIQFEGDASYYNLEFNCMGTALVGYGKDKHNRTTLARQRVAKIKSQSHISTSNGDIHWQLSLMIPFEVFTYHTVTSLQHKTCGANFFKCGDGMSEPHFLSWNRIDHPSPDFHLPEFMGQINFMV